MVKCAGRGLVVKRPGVHSKVQMLNLVLGVVVFSLLPKLRATTKDKTVSALFHTLSEFFPRTFLKIKAFFRIKIKGPNHFAR